MNTRTDPIRTFAAAAIDDWTGLPPDLSLAEIAEVLIFDPTDLRHGSSGDPVVERDWIPAVSSVYADGLYLWLDGQQVIALEGIHPLDEGGDFTPAPDLGEPDARLTTRLGPLLLDAGELVYAARGLAVRVNPENGLLLGLVGFVPTGIANYRNRIRPVQPPLIPIPRRPLP
jgi:hypothetical protein